MLETTFLKIYEPLQLDMPWLVASGSLAVYAATYRQGQPIGQRRFLFSVKSGEMLWPAHAQFDDREHRFLAEAETDTQLTPLSLETCAQQFRNPSLSDLLASWVNHLGKYLAIESPPPVVALEAGGIEHLTLLRGQKLRAKRGTVLCFQVAKGEAKWLGNLRFTLIAGSGWLPMGEGMWLEAIAPNNLTKVEIDATPLEHLRSFEVLVTSIEYLHRYFFRSLEFQEQLAKEADLLRSADRAVLNQQMLQRAQRELGSVLAPAESTASLSGSPMLIVMGAVGRAMGVPIRPVAASENLQRVNELEAIARSSRLRTRQVLLNQNWWQQDAGPLIAYVLPEKSPVALLRSGSHYKLFDPLDGRYQVVDERLASRIDPIAFMLYRPLPERLRSGVDLLRFSFQGKFQDISVMIALGVGATLLGMVAPQATGLLIDSAIPDADRGLLWQIGLAPLASALGIAVFQWARGMTMMRVETSADAVTQAAVWDKLLQLNIPFFRQYAIGDLEGRVSAVGEIRKRLGGSTLQTIFTSFFSLLNLGLLFYYSATLALLALGVGVLVLLFTTFSGSVTLRLSRPLQEARSNIFGTVVQLINGITKLKIAGAEERAFNFWSTQYTQQQRLSLQGQQIEDNVQLFNSTLPILSSGLLFWLAVALLTKAANQENPSLGLTTGTFLAFNTAFGTFLEGTVDLSNTLIDILDVVTLWERAQPILMTRRELPTHATDPGKLGGQLELSHVTFRYRSDGPLILEDVSLYANPGEFIALVGPSGSGKSTVLRMLLGFEIPESGTIYYDGQDLAGLDIYAVRRQVGTVLQNGRIMSASLFENIAAGAVITMEEAWQAVRMAGMEDDIKQMPMGMHTVISEGGGNLSGGQRQRLLIARSLVLKPVILLFDEATSALDNRTQSIISRSLEALRVTRVVIAHRLSTIRYADRIYVMEAGRVVQVGSYESLAEEPGLFSRLIARQLA